MTIFCFLAHSVKEELKEMRERERERERECVGVCVNFDLFGIIVSVTKRIYKEYKSII